jgi:NAD(P)-dependent dehydrogenase (short-subunit alcohol dehydrogenase family)
MSKVILITGISTGFGRQTARLLAGQGCSVYGTIRKECEISEGINVLKMDLLDHRSIVKAVEAVIEKEGRIDVLINNAGMHTGGPVETTPFENIELQMGTNFTGMVRLTREVLPVMRWAAAIINFSSIGGLRDCLPDGREVCIEGFSEALTPVIYTSNPDKKFLPVRLKTLTKQFKVVGY